MNVCDIQLLEYVRDSRASWHGLLSLLSLWILVCEVWWL